MRYIRSVRTWIGGIVLATAASAGAQDPEVTSRQTVSQADQASVKDKDQSASKLFDQAKVYMQKMQTAVHRGNKQRDDAKLQKDLIKLNCLNEKLAQSEGHEQAAEQALSALSDAVVRNDSQERNHEYSRIRILYQKVLVLGAEADNCVGEDSGYVGPSQIEVDVDPTIPQGDPTDPGLPTPNFVMAPPGVEMAASDSPPVNPPMM